MSSQSEPETVSPQSLSASSNEASHLLRERAEAAFKPVIDSGHSVAIVNVSDESHFPVSASLLWTLQQFAGLKTRVYLGNGWPLHFEDTIKHWTQPSIHSAEQLIDDLRTDTSIRYVVSTTGEWDIEKLGVEMAAAWTDRAQDEKFNVAFIRHWPQESVIERLTPFATAGVAGVGALGDHVREKVKEDIDDAMNKLSDSEQSEETRKAWKRVPGKTFIPVFPGEGNTVREGEMSQPDAGTNGQINTAIIQSRWWRGLPKVYKDLQGHLESERLASRDVRVRELTRAIEDSESWGYTASSEGKWQPIPDHPNRFQLSLIGWEAPSRPDMLEHVVRIQPKLSYPDFLGALRDADVVLTAFGTDAYIKDRVSATFGMAATAKVSVKHPLVTLELQS